ncbi:hypothetical protein RRG08_016258 [Elysia crispata]|uniref:Uncharacterized protein n=1 Tax=Elysia crispata TaxID=231223 RepID=A0AAE1AL66_9GAST|nr:hypothetical protein RRG08_016258 [Elysia crispata]
MSSASSTIKLVGLPLTFPRDLPVHLKLTLFNWIALPLFVFRSHVTLRGQGSERHEADEIHRWSEMRGDLYLCSHTAVYSSAARACTLSTARWSRRTCSDSGKARKQRDERKEERRRL